MTKSDLAPEAATQRALLISVADLPKWRASLGMHVESMAARSGVVSAPAVWKMIKAGRLQLWAILRDVGPTGALLTEIVSDLRQLRLVSTSGHEGMPDAARLLETLGDWGREQGCSALVATGRPDFLAKLPGMHFISMTVGRKI